MKEPWPQLHTRLQLLLKALKEGGYGTWTASVRVAVAESVPGRARGGKGFSMWVRRAVPDEGPGGMLVAELEYPDGRLEVVATERGPMVRQGEELHRRSVRLTDKEWDAAQRLGGGRAGEFIREALRAQLRARGEHLP